MAITTYAELKTAIADFLNRDDLTSIIPTFIELTEAQMAREVRHWRQEKRIETTLDERYENLPTDFIEAIRLTAGNNRLTMISAAEMQDRVEASTLTGTPKYYRFTANQIEFYPAPASTSTTVLSMVYYARTPSLTDAAPSNWILDEAPDAYLYGALVHSAPYLQDDPRIAVWASLYQNAIEGLRRDSNKGKYGGTLKMGVPR
jgi:hypothetical protein